MFHGDRGRQYASWEFRELLKGWGMRISMSRKGNCWENAYSEALLESLQGRAFAWDVPADPATGQGRGHRLAGWYKPQTTVDVGLQEPYAIPAPLARGSTENSKSVSSVMGVATQVQGQAGPPA